MNPRIRDSILASENVDGVSESYISGEKVVIELTKKNIKKVIDTLTCIICVGTMYRPMFALVVGYLLHVKYVLNSGIALALSFQSAGIIEPRIWLLRWKVWMTR